MSEQINYKDNENYKLNLSCFNETILSLKQSNEEIREKFLKDNLYSLKEIEETGDVNSFLLQFFPYLSNLIFFPNDEEVISKMRTLGFGNTILKFMVDLKDIETEIRRLDQIEGLLIFPYNFLYGIINHVEIKFKIEMVEAFGLSKIYNNSETNSIFIDSSNRIRRKDYNSSNNTLVKNSQFDILMNMNIDIGRKLTHDLGNEKEDFDKYLRKSLKGNTSFFINLLSQFYNYGISLRKVYLELFPLIKLIRKDLDYKLLTEDEFYNNDEIIFQGKYDNYKINKVKKLIKYNK